MGVPPVPNKRVFFVQRPPGRSPSFAEPLNKPAQLYGFKQPHLEPADPLVVRAGQLHVSLGVDQGLVAQPFLQNRNGDIPRSTQLRP